MFRALSIALAALFPAAASAQVAQFSWASGQALGYRVTQVTKATETVGEKTQETNTRLDLIKRWRVTAVDAQGVATLAMTVERLRMETKTPKGETLFFDSAEPAKSTPALKDEMAKYVGVPVVTVRIDRRGQLVEVKEAKFGSASRLQADLPFKITLPAEALAADSTWKRPYAIKLDPPQGTGESYDAVQEMRVKSIAGDLATIAVSTTIPTPPESPAEQVPLAPLAPVGEVVFDLKRGLLVAVKYQFQKELTGQQGDGSKYSFASTYVENLMQ